MKKFSFKLEGLLSFRKHLEKNAQNEVALVQMELNKLKTILADIDKEHAEAEKKVSERTEAGVSGAVLQQYIDYFKGLEFQKEVISRRVLQLNDVLKLKQEKLKEKSIEKKVIENIRGKKQVEYYDEMIKNEMKEADENILLKGGVNED